MLRLMVGGRLEGTGCLEQGWAGDARDDRRVTGGFPAMGSRG
jgi:hypothetical protein